MVDLERGEQSRAFSRSRPTIASPRPSIRSRLDRASISVFESGAIQQYLVRKTGRFGGETPREQVAVSEWLFWQIGGVGPMAGRAHHFRRYAAEKIRYAIDRDADEVNRLFGVRNNRLESSEQAPTRSPTWRANRLGEALEADGFPHLARWLNTLLARPAVASGIALDVPGRRNAGLSTDEECSAERAQTPGSPQVLQ